ncbi:uncharacterized protein EAF01_011621 [Botrytis porri]|uniref:uncharacterized protein n=1 Tax=Botrytis porri TaxID=87229 RepID=UPI00190168C6|nr:uncharacterized protein EAF01_011621 [Botrytis porri]KAF7883112.1 hypothetical protein EAF01_011621 [Botrytis porri]
MNQQNEPLLTIHDLLARVKPELRRANLPITIRIVTYAVAIRDLMRRSYLDEPVASLIRPSGIRQGAVKPYFWQALITILLIQHALAIAFWLCAFSFFMHVMLCIPILFLPTSLMQDCEKSFYIISWIITAIMLPSRIGCRLVQWRRLKRWLEMSLERYAV